MTGRLEDGEEARRRSGTTRSRLGALLVTTCMLFGSMGTAQEAQWPSVPEGVWMSLAEVQRLPMEGAAWEALVAAASVPTPAPNLSDQDDLTNVRVLAKALVHARRGDPVLRDEVQAALTAVRGTEAGARSLSVSRELMAYVIAADLIGLEAAARDEFESWLRDVRSTSFAGRTIRSTHEDRPNNWGTHAGATRIAVALYLNDLEDLERAAEVFKGYVGEPGGWSGFVYGAADWQASPDVDYGVNPVGATRDGHSIDGVLPDDQRRGGAFQWPPPRENYVYEALQGAVAQSVLLERAGYADVWDWGDRAILRAFRWLHDEAGYPAEGDDTWIPHLVNRAYGSDFPAPVPSRAGKGMGFTDWSHVSGPSFGDDEGYPPPVLE